MTSERIDSMETAVHAASLAGNSDDAKHASERNTEGSFDNDNSNNNAHNNNLAEERNAEDSRGELPSNTNTREHDNNPREEEQDNTRYSGNADAHGDREDHHDTDRDVDRYRDEQDGPQRDMEEECGNNNNNNNYSSMHNDRQDNRRQRSNSGGRGRERGQGVSVLVRHLNYSSTTESVRRMFQQYGDIVDVYAPVDFHSKRPRGFAFVEFTDEEGAFRAARDANGAELDEFVIEVTRAERRRKTPMDYGNRGGGRGDYGDRGRGRQGDYRDGYSDRGRDGYDRGYNDRRGPPSYDRGMEGGSRYGGGRYEPRHHGGNDYDREGDMHRGGRHGGEVDRYPAQRGRYSRSPPPYARGSRGGPREEPNQNSNFDPRGDSNRERESSRDRHRRDQGGDQRRPQRRRHDSRDGSIERDNGNFDNNHSGPEGRGGYEDRRARGNPAGGREGGRYRSGSR